ncbi:kinase-like protein [Suillus fuscotomentosus]|uniref:non-specific serine/threonine protein kinase n=1 Tax=Suillus fuscotomentosus TaxID=1912939 RepID=A0AAD4EHA0_9AGAM|nr:kinase-like protein [Suillus fuscotomentosus]KAG1906220.1 kinase-like protein [Suillus fuscotomentosus]
MFDESQPPSPNQPVVALAPLEPEWQPIFQASNQIVLYNPTSHALSITKTSGSLDFPGSSSCPYCHRPLPNGFDRNDSSDNIRSDFGSHSRASNYFQLLAAANQTSSRQSSPPLMSGSGSRHGAFPPETMAEGYFKAFFQEEYRLGMGANGSVYLCQHVLDGEPLGHFAVKKIAIGESHSYLLNILREIRLLESLHHRNIVTYHHAWLETYQFSAFGPKVPTLHVLMQWAEGGSLDDFIELRLGRSIGLPHMQSSSSPAPDDPTPSARIRAFRAMKRAPPEERERLRREMEDQIHSRRNHPSWKAVHLLSAEEARSLFADVTHGLAFLHDKSILHLDLKPGNVLLTWDEGTLIPRAMLSDFGTSRDMVRSSGVRSGNTGTLEYASPESLPSPLTGVLRQVDSKSDMWSLGMILHKMLFFKLPFRYATEGEATAYDEADKMDKLEQEILGYTGFRSTSALATSFESRSLPRSFLILLEGLLSINPSSRPSCERIVSAIREGRFDPVAPFIPPSNKSLIPLRRIPDESGTVQNEQTPPDASLTPAEHKQEEVAQVLDRKSPMLRLPSPRPDRRADVANLIVENLTFLRWRSPKIAWVNTLKACILAAKTLSAVSMWPSRPVLLGIIGLLAVLDTMFDGLEASLVLGVLHLAIIRWC